jgi:arginyl-tRNA synthetase
MKIQLFDELKKEVSLILQKAIESVFPVSGPGSGLGCGLESGLDVTAIYDLLVTPPQFDMGHLAFGCFPLAKLLKKGPPQISAALMQYFTVAGGGAENKDTDFKNTDFKIFKKIEASGPYLNFFFTGEVISKTILEPLLSGVAFQKELVTGAPKSMVEFSQPNTHKELHVGHMRNACLGDSLIRLMRYSGYPVISTTFPGDVGTHVAKCLWYLKFHNTEAIPEQGKGEWLGRIYSKAHLKLEDEEKTSQGVSNQEQMTLILKQLEKKTGEYFDLWKETRRWSIELMQNIYQWSDIHFDHWYWESDVDSSSVTWVKELYAQGKLVESQGAIGMDLSDKKLGFCVLLKSDGNGLYATKDLELARQKFQDHHIENSIYVVDMRQALHFQQVFEVLHRLGFKESTGCYHLQYNFVELPDGAMSSRKGNIVPILDLIHQMEDHVKVNYLEKYKEEWTTDEISSVAEIVAKGAIKYGMLRMDPNKKIVFDMKEWLKLDGESGPYIQYAYARIQSVLKKFELSKQDMSRPQDPQVVGEQLEHHLEIELSLLLNQFNATVLSAAQNHKPSLVCNYLYDLAKKFSSFYTECSIGYAENETKKNNRLLLSQATAAVLKQGLALLGIPVPARM